MNFNFICVFNYIFICLFNYLFISILALQGKRIFKALVSKKCA